MGGSRGMATAVAAELRFAREKAIAKGSPVAVVFPPGVSRSLFLLEGETKPLVTRVTNYQGDYPSGALAIARYEGPDFGPAPEIVGSKSAAWQERLNSWLPSDYTEYNVLMFTPNGSVVSNELPSADGSFRVIVGMGIDVSDGQVTSAGEPYTVAVSLSGAVEYDKGLLGGTGAVNTFGAASLASVKAPPVVEPDPEPLAPDILYTEVTPPAEEISGIMTHVLDKGEYLTLELYAKSKDGKPLYAGWEDTPDRGDAYKGRFSVPVTGSGPILERMEFFPKLVVDGKEESDIWRSVWTWTPPHNAEPGEKYKLLADVRDSTVEIRAERPNIPPVEVAPPGEILFESNRKGNWHLFTMWADGSRVRQLTKGSHNYRCPSVTANGEMIAYERNGDEIWIMNIDGTGQLQVGTGRNPTISPIGNAIAYMNMACTQVIVKRIDTAGGVQTLGSAATTMVSAPAHGPHNRLAFSPDGRVLYYTDGDNNGRLKSTKLRFLGSDLGLGTTESRAAHDDVGGLAVARKSGDVYIHADQSDAHVGRVRTDNSGGVGGEEYKFRASVGVPEIYPAPSPNEDRILFCRPAGGAYQIFIAPNSGSTFLDGSLANQLTSGSTNLRPVWISQRGAF